jgi:hypothetical protein
MPRIPSRGNILCFKEFFMDVDVLKLHLVPNSFPSSIDHFKGLGTHMYYSKPPNGTNIKNKRPLIRSRCHQLSFEASFLALGGYKIPLALTFMFPPLAMYRASRPILSARKF